MTAKRSGRQRATPWHTAVVAVVTLTVVLAPIAVSTSASGTMQIRAALLVSFAVIGIALTVLLAVAEQRLTLPWGLPAAAAALLLVALLWAALNAPVGILAILGAPLRLSGLATYTASLTLFFIVLMHFNKNDVERTTLWLLVPVAVTVIVGALQILPVSVAFIGPNDPMRGLLGNTNFASAFLGMSVPLSAWAAVAGKPSHAFRPLMLMLAISAFVLALLSRAIQGPIVAVVGLLPLIVAYGLNAGGRVRNAAFAVTGAGVVTGMVGAYGLLTSRGPLAWLSSYASVGPRMWYWEAALNMGSQHPLRGVGLGMYGHMYTQYRSVESVRDLPAGVVADDAHSIPLHLFAEGGIPLLLAYGLFAGSVLLACVLGLRSVNGGDRLMLGGLAGATLAYFTQALVSIEVAGLMPIGFVLAGLAVVAARREALDHRRVHESATNRKPRASRQPTRRPQTIVALITATAIAIPTLIMIWIPYRADAHAETASRLEAANNVDAALEEAQAAVQLFPQLATNYLPLVSALGATGNAEAGLSALEASLERDPFNRVIVGSLARATSALRGMDDARAYWDRLFQLDPFGVINLIDAGEAAYENEEFRLARDFAEQAIEVKPDYLDGFELLLKACEALEDEACATEADTQVDELQENADGS